MEDDVRGLSVIKRLLGVERAVIENVEFGAEPAGDDAAGGAVPV